MKRLYFIVAVLSVSATLVLGNSVAAQHGRSGGGGAGGSSGGGGKGNVGNGGCKGTAGNKGSKGNVGNKDTQGRSAARSRPRSYNRWSHTCYFSRYRCNGYYSPDDSIWYYWYEPFNCYLPVSYMETYPPVSGGTSANNSGVNSNPPLPPGATLGSQ